MRTGASTAPPFAEELEALRWTDVLEQSPRLAGDTRFMTDYFLPEHARYRRERYNRILEAMNPQAHGGQTAAACAARGRLRRFLGDAEAPRDFEKALELDPACAAAFAFRGEMRLAGDPRGALPDLDRAASLAPGESAYRLWRGYARFLMGDEAAARRDLDAAAARDERSVAALILRGTLRESAGDLSGAGEDYDRAANLDGRCPGLFTLRAALRWRRGERSGALEDAHRAILLHPENLDAFVRIAYQSLGMAVPAADGRGAGLLEAADGVLKLDPRCAWGHALRAEAIGRRRSPADARESLASLERAVALDPERAWLRAFWGRALSSDGRAQGLRDGLEELGKAARLAPESGWIRSWRAQVLDRLGRRREALAELDGGISRDPGYRLALAWRAQVRENLGDCAGAASDMTSCLEVMPRPTFRHRRALLRWRLGDVPGALEDLSECVERSLQYDLAYGGLEFVPALFDGAGREWRAAFPGGLWKSRPLLRGERLSGEAGRSLGLRLASPRFLREVRSLIASCRGLGAPRPLALDREALRKAARAAAGSALPWAWLGRSHLNDGDFAAALECLDRALAVDARRFPSLAWRGEAFLRMGRPARALEDLDAALALKSCPASAALWRAAARGALGGIEDCLEGLLEACRAQPARAPLVYWWSKSILPDLRGRAAGRSGRGALLAAELALEAGQARGALRLLAPVADSSGEAVRACALRARAKRLLGDLEGALAEARKASRGKH